VDASLPGGKEVSRPLTPVEITPEAPVEGDGLQDPKPNPVQRIEEIQEQKYVRRGPLGPGWDDFEFLLWWPKAAPVPPLVTTTRSGVAPVLQDPRTRLFVGGHSLDNQAIAGGRFTLGGSINTEETLGLEVVYFFLGTRTLSESLRGGTAPGSPTIGLPFVNSQSNQESVFTVSAPGSTLGNVLVTTTTRVQGVEANAVGNLYDGKNARLNAIIGYRYLQVNEGLTISQLRAEIGGASSFGPIYDGFDGHNQFNGGQIGLHADLTRGMLFCEVTGKLALGTTTEVIKVNGATTIYTPVLGGVSAQTLPGGVYALSSNIGRYSQSSFAVLPEGTLKFGIKLGDMGRFFVGYNFFYLSDLVRPGDQVDRTLNPAQIPALNPAGGSVFADRPRVPFVHGDFWAQGLLIGLETRY
jgi:hypothetical protein